MKTLIKGLALMLVMAVSSKAVPITGTIDFAGSATINNTNLALATQVNSGFGFVIDATDTFATEGVGIFDAVTFTFPWTFTSGAHAALWSVKGFTFNLISSSIIGVQTSSFLNVSGTGTMTHASYDDTPGVWTFTIPSASSKSNARFSFAASTSVISVPDTSSTVLLIGLGILGIGFAARRKS